MTDDYFHVGKAIVTELTRMFTELKKVAMVKDIASVKESQQITPAVYVVFNGGNPKPANSDNKRSRGERSIEVQNWYVVLAVKHAAAQDDVSKLHQEAGCLYLRLIKHLQGFDPKGGFSPLVRVSGTRAGYSPTFGYLPLSFNTEICI